jgi:hypothetical protein
MPLPCPRLGSDRSRPLATEIQPEKPALAQLDRRRLRARPGIRHTQQDSRSPNVAVSKNGQKGSRSRFALSCFSPTADGGKATPDRQSPSASLRDHFTRSGSTSTDSLLVHRIQRLPSRRPLAFRQVRGNHRTQRLATPLVISGSIASPSHASDERTRVPPLMTALRFE